MKNVSKAQSGTAAEYIYGINPVMEVARAGKRPLLRVFADKSAAAGRLAKLVEFLERSSIPVERTDRGALYKLTGSAEHQGVAAATMPYPYTPSEELLAGPRALLLDNIEDPQNLGAILRSAEVFGWRAVLLPRRGSPGIYPSVVKASAGATEHLSIAKDKSANAYARVLLERGFTLVALDASGRSRFSEIAPHQRRRVALAVGGENAGVGQFILRAAACVVGIPQRGRINSLNASVAAGIAMYALAPE